MVLIVLVLLVLLGVKALPGRWTVVAESGRGRATWKVRGNRRSKELVSTAADALAASTPPPPGSTFDSIAALTQVEREGNVRVVDR